MTPTISIMAKPHGSSAVSHALDTPGPASRSASPLHVFVAGWILPPGTPARGGARTLPWRGWRARRPGGHALCSPRFSATMAPIMPTTETPPAPIRQSYRGDRYVAGDDADGGWNVGRHQRGSHNSRQHSAALDRPAVAAMTARHRDSRRRRSPWTLPSGRNCRRIRPTGHDLQQCPAVRTLSLPSARSRLAAASARNGARSRRRADDHAFLAGKAPASIRPAISLRSSTPPG